MENMALDALDTWMMDDAWTVDDAWDDEAMQVTLRTVPLNNDKLTTKSQCPKHPSFMCNTAHAYCKWCQLEFQMKFQQLWGKWSATQQQLQMMPKQCLLDLYNAKQEWKFQSLLNLDNSIYTRVGAAMFAQLDSNIQELKLHLCYGINLDLVAAF